MCLVCGYSHTDHFLLGSTTSCVNHLCEHRTSILRVSSYVGVTLAHGDLCISYRIAALATTGGMLRERYASSLVRNLLLSDVHVRAYGCWLFVSLLLLSL